MTNEDMIYGWTIEKVQYTTSGPDRHCVVTIKAAKPGRLIKTFTATGLNLGDAYFKAQEMLRAYAMKVAMKDAAPGSSSLSLVDEEESDEEVPF